MYNFNNLDITTIHAIYYAIANAEIALATRKYSDIVDGEYITAIGIYNINKNLGMPTNNNAYYQDIINTQNLAKQALFDARNVFMRSAIIAENAISEAAYNAGCVQYSHMARTAYDDYTVSVHDLYKHDFVKDATQIAHDAEAVASYITNSMNNTA
jgi:hypothetical protein